MIHLRHRFVWSGELQGELAQRRGQFILAVGRPADHQTVGRRIDLDRQILQVVRTQRAVHGRDIQFVRVVTVHAHDLFRHLDGLLQFREELFHQFDPFRFDPHDQSAGDGRRQVLQIADLGIQHAACFCRIHVLQIEGLDGLLGIQPQFFLQLLDQLVHALVVLGAGPDQQLIGALAGQNLGFGHGGGQHGHRLGAGRLADRMHAQFA